MSFTFISGATGGIGKAFAEQLASAKNDLFLTGRSVEKLDRLGTEITDKYGVKVEYFACDLCSEDQIVKMLEYIDQKNIRFNRMVLVAGVDIQKGFLEYTLEKVQMQIRVNVEATIFLTHALLNRREKDTEVLTISSMSGVTPMPYFALYSATKAMLTNFFTALHYELKRQSVKVTVVLPGGVYTRPDIIEDIKGQGLWGKLSAKKPSFVVKKSLKAVKKNKIKYIPGTFNKILNFIIKILPKRLVLSFIARRWKKQSKDAF